MEAQGFELIWIEYVPICMICIEFNMSWRQYNDFKEMCPELNMMNLVDALDQVAQPLFYFAPFLLSA